MPIILPVNLGSLGVSYFHAHVYNVYACICVWYWSDGASRSGEAIDASTHHPHTHKNFPTNHHPNNPPYPPPPPTPRLTPPPSAVTPGFLLPFEYEDVYQNIDRVLTEDVDLTLRMVRARYKLCIYMHVCDGRRHTNGASSPSFIAIQPTTDRPTDRHPSPTTPTDHRNP